MESMYDKLGDLLSETLEAGHVKFFSTRHQYNESELAKPDSDSSSEKKDSSVKIKKAITSSQKAACKILGINEEFDSDLIKKAYHEKLKYFHPDHYQNNEILRNIAEKKTKEIIDAYNLLSLMPDIN